ncbi:MAG: S41 family peptidase, partial [Chlorobi bacterium]|nr:S41 family peptidase [Chlorobiota bacterium]
MSKYIYKIFILVIVIIFQRFEGFSQNENEQIKKFEQVINYIDNNYVDSVDNEQIIKSAIVASLKELDPHSVYYDKDEIEDLNRGLKGSFVGVGITYDIINDTVLILSVINDGPSEKAGVLAGDRIIKVDNKLIAGKGLIDDDKLRDVLGGKKETEVVISVKREGVKDLKNIKIIRNKVPVNSINSYYKVTDDIAYVRLKRFSATSMTEFKKVVDELGLDGSKKLILDLRGNRGGYLYVSVRLLENFLKKKSLVLVTKGLHSPEKEYKTFFNAKLKNTDLVVLINESSASASEIVSGAIQDWDRGVIVGRRSYGKGLVQKPFYLNDGSMMRLTIAKYYTPSGRNIQKSYSDGQDKYNHEISDRLENGELMHKDSVKHIDSLKYYTLNNKRLIYGGGGIMPDIFVELDTLKYPIFYKEYLGEGKINEFAHLFVDKNRSFLRNNYKNFEKFDKKWTVSKKNIEDLILYLNKDEKNISELINELFTNKYVRNHLKALVAYDVFGENEFYRILNEEDATFNKAIEI